MTPDKDFEISVEEVSPPRPLIQRLTTMHDVLRRVVLKVVLPGQSTPKKINGIKFEKQAPPEASPDEIAELLTQMALDDYDTHDKPPRYYEAWCEIAGEKRKSTKYIRFRVDPDTMGAAAIDETEIEVLMRACLTYAQEVSSQNKELHGTLLEHSKVLQEATIPYKDALEQMGEITANAFKQTAYALFLVMDTQRQDKELEIEHEKWKETIGIAKEFVPKAIRQKVERMMGIESTDDDDSSEGADEDGEKDDSTDNDEKKEKKTVEKT
jgi:hypothetical protein